MDMEKLQMKIHWYMHVIHSFVSKRRVGKKMRAPLLGLAKSIYLVNFHKILNTIFVVHCILTLTPLKVAINHLTPTRDQVRISSLNINTISSKQAMRIKKNIDREIIRWSNTNFWELTNIIRIAWQMVQRTTNGILGVKMLKV